MAPVKMDFGSINRINQTGSMPTGTLASHRHSAEAGLPPSKAQPLERDRATRPLKSLSQSLLRRGRPALPSQVRITINQSIINSPGILNWNKLKNIIIDLPDIPNLRRLGVPSLINRTNPRGRPERSNPDRLNNPSSPATSRKTGNHRKMRLNPTLRIDPATTQSSSSHEPQASCKSNQCPPIIPFSKQGILRGSTLKSPARTQGCPLATTASSHKAAPNGWSARPSFSASSSAP